MEKWHDAKSEFDAWIICQELMELKQERIASKKRSHLQAYEAEKRPSDINENPTAAEADKNLANCPEEISIGICAYRKDSNATHSPMWIWFSRIKQNQVICLLCHKTLHKQENNTSTCNLSQHMKKWHDAKSEFDAWIICQELIELKLQRLANKRRCNLVAYKEKNPAIIAKEKLTNSSTLAEIELKKKETDSQKLNLEERHEKKMTSELSDGRREMKVGDRLTEDVPREELYVDDEEEGEELGRETDGTNTYGLEDIPDSIRAYREDEDSIQSPVWIWFSRVDHYQVGCLLCRQYLRMSGSNTTNLSQHLRRAHGAETENDAWIICQELMELKQQRIASKKRSDLLAYEKDKKSLNQRKTSSEGDDKFKSKVVTGNKKRTRPSTRAVTETKNKVRRHSRAKSRGRDDEKKTESGEGSLSEGSDARKEMKDRDEEELDNDAGEEDLESDRYGEDGIYERKKNHATSSSDFYLFEGSCDAFDSLIKTETDFPLISERGDLQALISSPFVDSGVSGLASGTVSASNAPVHVDVGGFLYTTSLETLVTKFPQSRLAKMFTGEVPISFDSSTNRYFIDRDGRSFRHILNYCRTGGLVLPENFEELDLLYREAQYFHIPSLVSAVWRQMRLRGQAAAGQEVPSKESPKSTTNVECVTVRVSTVSTGERVAITARKELLADVLPELFTGSGDDPSTADKGFVIQLPVDGNCALNSLQVIETLLANDFSIATSSGSCVDGHPVTDYLLTRKRR